MSEFVWQLYKDVSSAKSSHSALVYNGNITVKEWVLKQNPEEHQTLVLIEKTF